MKRAIFDKKNILVAGGAGFVGSHLCEELVKNSKVICLDNFLTGDEKNIDYLLSDPNFEFIKHDITQPIDLENLPELQNFKIQFQGIQEVYNLACPNSPLNFKDNVINTLLANSLGTKNLLDLAIKYESKFLHFSSSVIYGPREDGGKKVEEKMIGRVDLLSERSSYDEGKRFAETMVDNYRNIYNIDAKIIRLFRTYGPRMKLDDGNMIPDFITNALDNKVIDIPADENFHSTFCYVTDVVDAAIKMMDSESAGPINIGSDVEVSVFDIAHRIVKMLNSKSEVRHADKHFFITPLAIPDINKSRSELGWLPIQTLDKGLEATIHDLRANKGIRRITDSI
ncbi:MAG: NAD-dependent epimerase/dehydratase family protein [Patescibacteria group bacterium]|jgi:UDP-glucuronate decarboxylase|nr:NAD-dependent epimerase/dehydratase family protein [Patescibacteria group bacterium]